MGDAYRVSCRSGRAGSFRAEEKARSDRKREAAAGARHGKKDRSPGRAGRNDADRPFAPVRGMQHARVRLCGNGRNSRFFAVHTVKLDRFGVLRSDDRLVGTAAFGAARSAGLQRRDGDTENRNDGSGTGGDTFRLPVRDLRAAGRRALQRHGYGAGGACRSRAENIRADEYTARRGDRILQISEGDRLHGLCFARQRPGRLCRDHSGGVDHERPARGRRPVVGFPGFKRACPCVYADAQHAHRGALGRQAEGAAAV